MFENCAGIALLTIEAKYVKEELIDLHKEHWIPIGYRKTKDKRTIYVILMARWINEGLFN